MQVPSQMTPPPQVPAGVGEAEIVAALEDVGFTAAMRQARRGR